MNQTGNLPTLHNWLRFRHLALIDSLARTGNMHSSAQQLGLSQPAVSKMLRDIENQFGFTLFERLNRELPATELGAEVIAYAQRALNDCQTFSYRLESLRQGGHGYLKVGAIFAATAHALPETLLRLKGRRPLLTVELLEDTSDHLLKLLEHKQLDLVVGRFTDHPQRQRFDFTALAEEPFLLIARPEHPLCARQRVSPTQLTEWPWVLYPLNTPLRQSLEQSFSDAGVNPPANSIETTSVQTTLKLLCNSDTLALLPEAVVRQNLLDGSLKQVQTNLAPPPLAYGVLLRKDEPISSAARDFIEALRAAIRDE
ncbi:LysR family transcriptional regulator [Ectopseudomonas alcaliphila]|uniref:LysR family transcriptional regulator n=1 Tax=Ectopseudomonas alcaliphila TaxID=101564 RepID=UPI00277D2C56|nr:MULTISPECIES: LysR family transcriptional regulator [Pseudomonas]MDP9938873.1 DNA-binding transcriptional LysR family regulator [Pseudomonas sp. 3400]MDR7011096.1 DNA-binding transcriptional LysR family regulator [Pseudomonas alcaliphila]